MRGFLKAGLLAICFSLILVQSVSAFNVSQITIDPRGSLVPGTPVVITGTIDLVPSSEKTFESLHEIQFSTFLENAKWNLTLVIEGTEELQPTVQRNTTTLTGWILSYPKGVDESLKFKLEGTAPVVAKTTNKTILKIQEVDESGIPVPDTRHEYTTVVVNPGSPPDKVNEKRSILQTFNSHIEEKSANGVNTTLAEAKSREAEQKIERVKALPSIQYLEAQKLLDSAQTDIDDGEILLNKAWAEKEVADAQVPINNVDAVIAWVKGNASTWEDAQLPAIMTKREVALSYLESARDEINKGNFEQARLKAEDAYNKGNESYNDACRRSELPGCGNNPPPKPRPLIIRMSPTEGKIIVLLIAGILCVAGFFWWGRRKRSWRE